jgi:hypothetical protein
MDFESLPSVNDVLKRARPEDYIFESCRIAGLIYLRTIVFSLPFSDTFHQNNVLYLRASVEKTDVHSSWGAVPEALIWVCLVGAAASKLPTQKAWFIACLGPVFNALGTLHFKELVSSMNFFALLVRKAEARSLWMK